VRGDAARDAMLRRGRRSLLLPGVLERRHRCLQRRRRYKGRRLSKRVLVTGGSRGIGKAACLRLAEDGWTPLVHYKERADEAREVAAESGGEACPFGADLSKAEDCDQLWEWADGPDALVNNAGVYSPLPFDTADSSSFDDAWRFHYEANFGSALRLTRRFVLAGKSGKIVNVASRVGFKGEAGAAHYAASKAAMISLVRSLAVELAPKGFGVFGIAPGWVETAMARDGMDDRESELLASIPLGRMATPEDCAAAIAFLLRDESAYLSGEVIDINGASYFH
jgi:3-oxoacyl-[acyl-carrier protein] reductase